MIQGNPSQPGQTITTVVAGEKGRLLQVYVENGLSQDSPELSIGIVIGVAAIYVAAIAIALVTITQ